MISDPTLNILSNAWKFTFIFLDYFLASFSEEPCPKLVFSTPLQWLYTRVYTLNNTNGVPTPHSFVQHKRIFSFEDNTSGHKKSSNIQQHCKNVTAILDNILNCSLMKHLRKPKKHRQIIVHDIPSYTSIIRKNINKDKSIFAGQHWLVLEY